MNSRYNLCLFNDSFNFGGTERQFVQTISRLNRDKYNLTVACLEAQGGFYEEVRAAGIEVLEFPKRGFVSLTAVRSGWRCLRLLRSARIDLVHSFDFYSNLFAIPVARLAGVPVCVASQRNIGTKRSSRQLSVQRQIFQFVDCVVANSEAARQKVVGEGMPPGRVRVLRNGIDLQQFKQNESCIENRRRLQLPEDALLVAVVANLRGEKDHRTLLDAMPQIVAAVPRAHFLLVGTGPLEEELRGYAESRKLSAHVTFLGKRSDVPDLLSACDLSVLPTLTESLPNAVLEAMSAGLAVVASNVGGCAEVIDQGNTGVLVPPKDPRALAREIIRLLENAELRRRMGESANSYVQRELNADLVVKRLEEIYDELLEEKCSRPTAVLLKPALRTIKRLGARALYYSGAFLLIRRLHERRYGRGVRIIYYHRVSEDSGVSNALGEPLLTADEFSRHLLHLRRFYNVIPASEAAAALSSGLHLPRNAVVVTFDDGYRDNYTVAYPLLERFKIPATIFVTTSAIDGQPFWLDEVAQWFAFTQAEHLQLNGELVGLTNAVKRRRALERVRKVLKNTPGTQLPALMAHIRRELCIGETQTLPTPATMSWDELRAMTQSGLVEAGSHTISHPIIPNLDAAKIEQEIGGSCDIIADKLGNPVRFFAYPNGNYNSTAQQTLRRLGIVGCTTGGGAGFNAGDADMTALRRTNAEGWPSYEFALRLAGWDDVMSRRMEKSATAGAVHVQKGPSNAMASTNGKEMAPKILQISNYPPPQCGWAVQTKLLMQELRQRGAVCEVLNINENRKIKNPEYIDVQNGADYLWKLLKFALRGYRFHTHVNAESKPGYLLALSAHLVGRIVGRPSVMTFHGGLPQTYFPRNNSRFLRWVYRFLFLSAGDIICNSEEMKRAIQSYGMMRKPIAPIPGFSPQYISFQTRALAPEIEDFLVAHKPVFFCFLCFRPEYALASLLKAMKVFSERHPGAGFIWLGFPEKEVPPAKAYLDAIAGGAPRNLLLLGNLDHDTFLTLLGRCFAYIRPPECDGISASVLESLAIGTPVIAAENGRRPAGVVTFRFNDADDLCSKLFYVVENYEVIKRRTKPVQMGNNLGRTAEWILGSGQPVARQGEVSHAS